MTIRACNDSDFPGVRRLLEQLWPDQKLNESAVRRVFDRALASDSQIYLCALDNERLIGFVSLTVKNNLWQAGNLGHIDELIVDEQYRGHGLGTRLLRQIVDAAKEMDCTRVELDSAFYRKSAHGFYERHGFEKRAYLFSKSLS